MISDIINFHNLNVTKSKYMLVLTFIPFERVVICEKKLFSYTKQDIINRMYGLSFHEVLFSKLLKY